MPALILCHHLRSRCCSLAGIEPDRIGCTSLAYCFDEKRFETCSVYTAHFLMEFKIAPLVQHPDPVRFHDLPNHIIDDAPLEVVSAA